ncbi:MAG: endo-1,4-beta-xylanase [Planctomycetales bacterium]|nr:endo-1,4-beta-xylanase [Planctomycetales bacterium]
MIGARALVVLGLVCAALARRSPAADDAAPAAASLRAVADERGLCIGAMILDDGWRQPAQQALVARQFNAATVGAYWTRTHPARDRWNWQLTDDVVAFAEANDMAVHLHPLLYPADDKSPTWLTTAPAADARAILAAHVEEAVGRYRGRCAVWDVVNEAVAPNGRGLRDCWWLRSLGRDYVATTFRLARQHDPDAALLYNEYGCELSDSRQSRRWETALQLVRELHAAGLIDGFGWQLHVTPDDVLGDDFALDERMQQIASLGLDNYVTELDVAIPDDSPASLRRQADAYRRIAEIWLRRRGDGWLQTWGVSDRHTWLDPPHAANDQLRRPLLFDDALQPKPAYYALLQTLQSAPTTTDR